MNEEYDYIINAFTQSEDKTNLEVNNLNVECITSTNNNFSLDSNGNLTVKSITAEEGAVSQSAILDFVYPVGSIYMSVNDANPNVVFGGTWEQIKDKFILSCGDTYANGATGGEAVHTLTESELPEITGRTRLINIAASTVYVSGKFTKSEAGTSNYTGLSANSRPGTYLDYSFGGGESHNNMPPYIVVYVWKRTA